MGRFYRVIPCLLAAAYPAVARAQTIEHPPLGSSITVDALGRLPAAGNLFSLLDTAVPEVIADRIDTGGVSAGDPARLGAHGNTWTQTLVTVGDVDITDASGRGTPLLVPGVEAWRHVDVATGLIPIERNAPGLAITLIPRAPATIWSRSFSGLISPPALNATGDLDSSPPIAHLNNWLYGNLVASGPIVPGKLGIFASVAATRSTHFERADPGQIDANLASAFLSLAARPRPNDEVRVIGWLQRSRDPVPGHLALLQPNAGEIEIGLHTQAAWDHLLTAKGDSLHAFGGVTTRRSRNGLASPPFIAVERLRYGPIPDLLDAGPGTDRVWSFGARAHASAALGSPLRHDIVAGVEGTGATSSIQSTFTGTVGELIDGIPARVWMFTDPADPSHWRSTGWAAYISDTVAVHPRLTITGGLRFDAVNGSRAADDAPAIRWRSLLPRAGAHWTFTRLWNLSAFGQYDRYAHRLPLADLAYGDPAAPTGSVFRWNAPVGAATLEPGTLGALVQRVGPGTGGDPRFTAIDPALRRPTMDEAVLGFESQPRASTFLRIAAIGRRERHLVGVADVGVPASTYSTIGVPDPGVDLVGSQDDQILLFYNRSPATFGQDRYLVTNTQDDEASFVGAEISGRFQGRESFIMGGITAGRSEAWSANRGFGPLENDAGLLGEVFTDPNAHGHAQGRVFTERGYTIKVAGARHLPHDIDLGIVARYQDGQHFARLVILDGLNQGAEAVRAFRNGRTRFTFSGTLDVRLQKAFAIGGRRVTAVVDGYNVLNMALEVEEYSVTGATSRLTSAVQPPRVVQIGFRLPF